MDDDYTPTTEEVETHWADVGFASDRASFRRWLDAERAAAWDEGAKWAASNTEHNAFLAIGDNPYRAAGTGTGGSDRGNS